MQYLNTLEFKHFQQYTYKNQIKDFYFFSIEFEQYCCLFKILFPIFLFYGIQVFYFSLLENENSENIWKNEKQKSGKGFL